MEEKAGRKLYVFISCPSDVEEEKRIVETACSWLTKTSLPFMGIEIVPIRWPNNIISQITGEDSQAVINKQIGSYDYDIYIGIMWTRFGDRKANGLTPTEDEFEIALNNYRKNKKPFIQFYFKLDEFSPHDTNEELQYAEVQRFKNKIRESDLGIYKDFKGRNQFEKAIQDSLIHIVKNFDSLTAPDTIVPKIQYLEVKPYLPRKACNRKDYASGQLLYYTDKYAKDTLDIVSECKRIVLVNDAGTGKTTELKRIAANFSKAESPFYPFFVSLNKYVGQSLSEYLPTGWKDVPDSKIAVILDGLDEIESKNKRDAIRQIELFAEQYPKINIIVSCRTNFYESETEQLSGTLSGFASFLLLELGEKEIGCYVKESLNEGSESFYKGVSNKRLHDLLKIPFYLVHLVELFRKNLALPSHKGEIFEQLLENRIEQDIEHYRTTIPLKEEQTDIFETLQKLALGMEVLGRNYISNDEYRQIIEDQSLRELIEHCSVWKKDDSDQLKWQFEHNNFQEYLAARILSTEPLTTLKEFMFFAPNYRKLIPSWSNTLSFLISISDSQDLIQWILENEPELAVKCEPDRIEIDTRISIFKRIFNRYKEKQIWINREKFSYGDLAKFGRSNEVVEFLLTELEDAEHYTTASNAIELLGHLKIPQMQWNRACELLVGYAVRDDFGDQVQNRALMALGNLDMNTLNVVTKVAEALQESESEWVRYGLYYFLHKSKYLDENIHVLLNGLRYVRLDISASGSRLFDEHWHLRIGLEKAKSPDSLMQILKHFAEHPQDLDDTVLEKSISVIAENAVTAYSVQPTLFQEVKALFEILVKTHLDVQARQLLIFFNKTETRLEIFREYLFQKRNDTERWSIVALVANTECIEYFVKQFEQGNLEDDDVLNFRSFLGWENSDLYSSFNNLINERTGNRFLLPQERDYEKERKERSQRDFALLFDKEAFLDQIKLIFDTEGKECLTDQEIMDVQSSHWDKPYFSNLAIRQLRNLAKKGFVTFSNVVISVNNWNWDWFCICNVYEKLTNSPDLILMNKQKEWIENWCYSNLDKVNFKMALITKSKQSSSSSYLAIFLWHFLRKFGLSYPKHVLLDLISYDWSEGGQYVGIEYLESLLSYSEMSKRVLDNLDEGIQNEEVLKNHLDYCKRHNAIDVMPHALEEFKNADRGEGVRKIALDTVCKFSSTAQSDLENALMQIQDDFRWVVIEKLLETDSSVCHEYLLSLLQTADDEEKLRSAQKLIELQDMRGLKYFVDWVRMNKKAPEKTHYDKSPLSSLYTLEAVPYLTELLKISYQSDFITSDYDYFGHVVLDVLTAIALQSDENYQSVRKATESFINENISLLPNINFLSMFIEKLDQKYYVSKSEGQSINDVIAKLKTALGS